MTDNVFDFEDDIEESTESLTGGGFSLLPSDIYKVKIAQAYMIESKNGAKGIVFDVETQEGKKHTETLYITNVKGQPYYMRDNKKVMLPSMVTVNALAKLLGFKNFGEVFNQRKRKAATKFDWESRKEITVEVEMLVKFCGKVVSVAMLHRKENKNKKVGNAYVPTNEAREYNVIVAFLDKTTNRTSEELANNGEAVEAEKFLAKYKGQIDDKFKEVDEPDELGMDDEDPLSGAGDLDADDDF